MPPPAVCATRGFDHVTPVARREATLTGAVTGPAIYRHLGAKASVLTAVFDKVIDAVMIDPEVIGEANAGTEEPAARLRHLVTGYAAAVSGRQGLTTVFTREVHSLPAEDRALLDERQHAVIGAVAPH